MATQKEIIMKNLGVSETEADEILAFDKAIEKGERTEFDLSPEKEKEALKMANVKTRKTNGKVNRTKKENPTKQEIISKVAEVLQCYDNVNIENAERIIAFSVGEDNFTITLTQKRKKS